MRKKLALLFLVAVMLNLALISFQSCCSRRSDICSILTGLKIQILDNADSVAHDPAGQVIAKAMILQLNLSDSATNCVMAAPAKHGFVTAAYAYCKRDYPYAVLDSMVISSDHDFDAAHPAGSNLRKLFYIQDSTSLLRGGQFNCYLRNVPDDTGTHTFRVHMVVHYDGYNYDRRVFDAIAQPVKLLE